MDLIVGIDPSAKKIAWVGHVPTLNVIHTEAAILYKAGQRQTMATMGLALDKMDDLIGWATQVCPHGGWYAWVEDPLIGRGGAVTTMKQAYIGGIIRGKLHNAGFEVSGVNVSTWKKQVCGNGRADKAAVQYTVKMQWPKCSGLIGNDGDLADAAAIALYGQRSLRIAAGTGSSVSP